MKTCYVEKGDIAYNCPYCNTEVVDWTGDDIQNGEEYCSKCGKEFEDKPTHRILPNSLGS